MNLFSVVKLVIIASAMFLTACAQVFDKHIEWETVQPETYPTLKGVGYAPISAQRGSNQTEKMLAAIKASKLDAYRELAEQVYGQKIDSSTSIGDLVVTNSQLRASVQGMVKGAKVQQSYPLEDMYVTELSLAFEDVYNLYLVTAKPRRIKNITYY